MLLKRLENTGHSKDSILPSDEFSDAILGEDMGMIRCLDFVVFVKNNDFTSYNSKYNSKYNIHDNRGYIKKGDLCLRLRILFVSSIESKF